MRRACCRQLYAAAGIDAEYYGEVTLGVGTARAQQGRLLEAVARFEAASRIDPSNAKLRGSLQPMAAQVAAVEALVAGDANAVADVCGTPCQDVVDGAGTQACALTWAEGCGDAPPPDGRTADATVAELCAESCTFFAVQGELELGEGNHM